MLQAKVGLKSICPSPRPTPRVDCGMSILPAAAVAGMCVTGARGQFPAAKKDQTFSMAKQIVVGRRKAFYLCCQHLKALQALAKHKVGLPSDHMLLSHQWNIHVTRAPPSFLCGRGGGEGGGGGGRTPVPQLYLVYTQSVPRPVCRCTSAVPALLRQ